MMKHTIARFTVTLGLILLALGIFFVNEARTQHTSTAYASSICSQGSQTTIPTKTFTEQGSHGSYYLHINGHDCDQYPTGCTNCWWVSSDTEASLSTGTGVDQTEAYVQGQDRCGSNPYTTDANFNGGLMQGGGWGSGNNKDTGGIGGYFQDCDGSGHDYRVRGQHYAKVNSNSPAQGETGCDVPPNSQYSSC